MLLNVINPCIYIYTLSFNGLYAQIWAFQVALVVENPLANARDISDSGSTPVLGRSPGGEHAYPLQYACLESRMNRGDCWAIVHGVTKNRT